MCIRDRNVTFGAGDDTVATITGITGTLALGAGSNHLNIGNSQDISAATVSVAGVGVYDLHLLDGGSAFTATLSASELQNSHAYVSNQSTGSITIDVHGDLSGYSLSSAIDTLVLDSGTNDVVIGGVSSQNIDASSAGANTETVHISHDYSGTYTSAASQTDVLDITATSDIHAATLAGAGAFKIHLDSAANATMTIAENGLISSTSGSNTVTLTDAGSVSGNSHVASYNLASTGPSTFTFSNALSQEVIGNGAADNFHVTLPNIGSDNIATVDATSDHNVANDFVTNTSSVGNGVFGYMNISGFEKNYDTFNVEVNGNSISQGGFNLVGDTGVIFGTDQVYVETWYTQGTLTDTTSLTSWINDNLMVSNQMNTFVLYSSTDILNADAGIYKVIGDGDHVSAIQLVGIAHSVGYEQLSYANFHQTPP